MVTFLIDDYERPMNRTHRPTTHVVPARGRLAGIPTNVAGTFRVDELDSIAPLTSKDRWLLSRVQNPPDSVKAHIAARIELAHILKFRR